MCWLKQSNYNLSTLREEESSPLENGLKGVKCFVLTPTTVLRHIRNALTEDNDAYKTLVQPTFSKNPLFENLPLNVQQMYWSDRLPF